MKKMRMNSCEPIRLISNAKAPSRIRIAGQENESISVPQEPNPDTASNRTFEYRRPHMDIDESKKEPVMRDHEDSEPMRTDRILFQFTLTMNLLLE